MAARVLLWRHKRIRTLLFKEENCFSELDVYMIRLKRERCVRRGYRWSLSKKRVRKDDSLQSGKTMTNVGIEPNYADQLIRFGRIEQADALLIEVESRFDDYKWRGTEKRLRLHLQYPYDWTLEKEWLSASALSIPVDEIVVLRLVVLLSNERGWCEIGTQAWQRWRTLMSTGLDDIEGLVNQCDGD